MVFQKTTLPRRIKVKNHSYRIKTDFRDWIVFEAILLDPAIDTKTKILTLQGCMFIDPVYPEDIKRAFDALFSFYYLNMQKKESKGTRSNKTPYSFYYDWGRIYSAFMQQYQIDLFDVDMHWFKFKSLFDNLTDDTEFIKIVGYRTMDLSKIEDKKEKEKYMRLQQLYKLPELTGTYSRKSAKEREAEILAKLKAGGVKNGS